jgi:putative membrane protein
MKVRGLLSVIATSPTLSNVSIYAALVSLYALIPVLLETRTGFRDYLDLPSEVHAVLTLVLGWLLVFRTNASYQRWWEARTLWGALVNCSRNLAIKVADLVPSPGKDLDPIRNDIVAFAVALRDHLRDGAQLNRLEGFHDSIDQPVHVPAYLVSRMYSCFARWKAAHLIDGDELRVLDADCRRFLDICGGCERIRNTLLARSYRAFARQCVFLVLATLPWGIVDSFRWWTIPLTGIISYFMIGMETVAEHVEEPFGHDDDDLDLDSLCRTIEVTVTEIFDRRKHRDAVT